MIVISSGEFREHQKKYFEMAEKEPIIVQRGRNKSFTITVNRTEDDYFSNPAVQKHLQESMEQAQRGEFAVVLNSDEDIRKYLGL